MKIYTIKELTVILQLTRQTIYTYIKKGKIEASNISIGKRAANYRITEESLNKFLKIWKKS